MRLHRLLKENVIYWPPAAFDDYGQPVTTTPVDMKCHWEDISEEYLDAQGKVNISRSKVYLITEVVLGGYLMLGTVEGLPDPNVKVPYPGGPNQIRSVGNVPNVKASQALIVAIL